MKLGLQWLLPLIPNPTAWLEVRRTIACMPTGVRRTMPWMRLQVEDHFQLLCCSKNLSQRGSLESHFNYPNREIEDPKTGQRKKVETVEVSCDPEG